MTALRLAADEHWDLVVADLDMPGMIGLELLGALRQVAPALPVAVVSAHVLDGMPAGLLGPADHCWRSRCGWISSSRRRPR